MEYEAMELIEEMYSIIAEAKPMPLAAGRCIVERNDLLSMLEELRDSLPREMEEARRLWEAKDEFIASAKREAEQIRKDAEKQARELVEKEEIVKLAKERAEELLQNANAKRDALFQLVNGSVDESVAASEAALMKSLEEVRALRYQLRGAAPVQSAAPAQTASPVQSAAKGKLAPKGFEIMSADDFADDEE